MDNILQARGICVGRKKLTFLKPKCNIILVHYLAWKLIPQNSESWEVLEKSSEKWQHKMQIDLGFQNWLAVWGHESNLCGVFTLLVAKID